MHHLRIRKLRLASVMGQPVQADRVLAVHENNAGAQDAGGSQTFLDKGNPHLALKEHRLAGR